MKAAHACFACPADYLEEIHRLSYIVIKTTGFISNGETVQKCKGFGLGVFFEVDMGEFQA